MIAEWRSTIKSDGWRWVVGMMAAYGLRNHEVFYANINSDNFPQIEVLEGKSGGRLVYPLYPEWPTQWSLDQICLPNLENIDGLSHAKLGSKVSGWFLDNKAPCKPYDLYQFRLRRNDIVKGC